MIEIVAFLRTCPFIDELSNIFTDFVGAGANDLGIFDEGEQRALMTDFAGNVLIPHRYALVARKSSADDLKRLAASNFSQRFTEWVFQQHQMGNYPKLPAGYQAWKIEASNAKLTARSQDTKTSVYEIPITLQYWRFI